MPSTRARSKKRSTSTWCRPAFELLEDRCVPAAVTPPSGLIGWWSGDGHAADFVNGNDGILQNGATYAAGRVGQAFSLDGVDDYVRVPHNSVLNPTTGFTIEAWIRSNSTSGARTIVSKWDDAVSDWSYIFKDHNSSDKLRIEFSEADHNDLADLSGTTRIRTNQWAHVAATYDPALGSNQVKLYFNGSLDASLSVGAGRFIDDSLVDLLIGAANNGVENFSGLIDEVSLYSRALTQAEIQSINGAGADGKIKPMTVVGSTPAAGAALTTQPSDFTVHFSLPYVSSSVQAADFSVNGTPANSAILVDADSVTFHYNTSPVTAQGPQTMTLAAGSITGTGGVPLTASSRVFYYDLVPMQVTSSTPATGGFILLPGGSLQLHFNEAYGPSSVGTDDLVVNQGSVTGFSLIDADTVEYTIGGLVENSTNLSVTLPAGAVTDSFGNPGLGFSGSYVKDVSTAPYTGFFKEKPPSAGLIFQASQAGRFNAQPSPTDPGDTDAYTLDVDAGQTLTVRVSSSIAANVTVTHSVLGPLTLPADDDPGSGRRYQTIAINDAGTVTIGLQAPDGASTGSYALQLTLNAFLETATADVPVIQSLDAAFVDVDPGAGVVSRAGVIASVEMPQPHVLVENEGTYDLRGSWDLVSANNYALNSSGNPNTPLNLGVAGSLNRKGSGNDASDPFTFHARAGDVVTIRTRGSSSGGGTLTKATVLLQLPDATQITGTQVVGAASDYQVASYTVTQTGTHTIIVGTDAGLKGTYTLTANLTSSDVPYGPEEIYSFTIASPGWLSVAAATGFVSVSQPAVALSLYGPGVDPISGIPVASSSSSGSLDGWIGYNATATGTYHVKVSNTANESGVSYELEVTAGGVFEKSGANETFATAQDITGAGAVVGALRSTKSDFIPYGSGGLANAAGLAIGADGNFYVAAQGNGFPPGNHTVLRYDSSGAFLGVFVSAGSGGLSEVHRIVFGPDGHLYAASGNTDSILRYNGTTGAFMNAFVASGSGGLDRPHGLVFQGGSLYVVSSNNDRVLRYNATTGAFIGTFVSGGSGGLDHPTDLLFGPDGNLYVSSWENDRVLRYNGSTGAFVDTFVTTGSGGLNAPNGLAFGPDGSLYVAGYESHNVVRYNGSTGAYLDALIPQGNGAGSHVAVAVNGGRLYVTAAYSVLSAPFDFPDYYRIAANPGTLVVTTATPGDGAGQPTNVVNPRLELFNSSGTPLATGTTLGDGRNEQIVFAITEAGTYYVKVSPEAGTTGTYLLTTAGGQPLLAAGTPQNGSAAPVLDEASLGAVLAEAMARWQAAGADVAGRNAKVHIAELPAGILGLAGGNTIWLDDNAAGWGWFVDPTPGDDSEFFMPGDQGEEGRMDLLTALAHEIGHLLGMEHEEEGTMYETLGTGMREMPVAERVAAYDLAAIAEFANSKRR